MANVTLGGNPITVAGNFPKKGDSAPEFTLTAKDLKDLGLKDFAGKRKVLNIVPSLIRRCARSPPASSTRRRARCRTRSCW